MASTHAKAVRRASVLQRLSARLGVEQADLHAQAKGDPEMALIMTLERVADAVEANVQAQERGDLRSVVAAASDDELVAIPGIGEKSLAQLREWAAEQPTETPQKPTDKPDGDEGTETQDAPDNAPPVTIENVERQLEAETGHDVVQTSDDPHTFVETDKPAPKTSSTSKSKAK